MPCSGSSLYGSLHHLRKTQRRLVSVVTINTQDSYSVTLLPLPPLVEVNSTSFKGVFYSFTDILIIILQYLKEKQSWEPTEASLFLEIVVVREQGAFEYKPGRNQTCRAYKSWCIRNRKNTRDMTRVDKPVWRPIRRYYSETKQLARTSV